MARAFALLERKRLRLSDDEYAQFEAYLLRNIRRYFRGEALELEPQFWFEKNRRFQQSQRSGPSMRGITPEEFDRNELEYKRRNLDKLPPDERQRVEEQMRWEARARYIEAEGGGLLAHIKAFLNPAFDGMGTINDAAIIASGFTGVPGLGPNKVGPPELFPTSRVRSAAGQGAQLPASRGVWGLGPAARGIIIHQRLGENLPPGFPVIDKFTEGTVTSIKSIDLMARTYKDPNAILRLGVGYISDVAEFQAGSWGGTDIAPEEILARALELVVPGKGTKSQREALAELIRVGNSKSVKVTIIEMPE
jgi:hypothetical protein